MKYAPHIYAEALLKALEANPSKSTVIHNRFLQMLQNHGEIKALPKIVREAERLMRKQSGARSVVVETARPLTKDQRDKLKNELQENDTIEERIDAELLAGMKLTIDREWVIDATLKQKLKKLFV